MCEINNYNLDNFLKLHLYFLDLSTCAWRESANLLFSLILQEETSDLKVSWLC